jgi:hypothetical protein
MTKPAPSKSRGKSNAQPSAPPRHKGKRRRTWLAPVLVTAAAALTLMIYLLAGQDSSSDTTCQELIARAMQASERFSQRGDLVDIDRLLRLSAAPLDLTQQVWGVAVLRLMANLPRSLPGETVTMIVFGNTTLGSQGAGLQSFYFYSEVGQIGCAEVPYDGIMITMPDGVGINLKINGAELTLNGDASLKAARNGQMDVSVFEGSASIVSGGEEQVVAAGEQASVDLGGEDGTEAIGPPSDPEPQPPDDAVVYCAVTGQNCPPTPTPQAIEGATASSDDHDTPAVHTPAATPTRTPSATAQPETRTATSRYTPTVTSTATATRTPSMTPMAVPSDTPQPTDSASPTPSESAPAPLPSATQTSVTPTLEPTPSGPGIAPPLDSFVAFAQEGIWLEQGAILHSGNVGANTSSPGPYLTGSQEVVIDIGTLFELPASQVVGDSLLIRDGAQVYDVIYNDVTVTGTVSGGRYTPLALPVASLPDVPSFSAGSTDLNLATGQSLTLAAGDYGQLITKARATITFTGGLYTFASWSIGQNSSLYFLAPTEIRISGQLDTGTRTHLGPGDGSGITAADILIVVTGINGSTGAVSATPKALQIGQSSTLIANLYAPNGTIWLKQKTVASGAFLGRWVDIGPAVELTIESIFH